MSKAEKFIQDYTRNCSNEILRNKDESFTNIPRKGEYNPWLTPDQAREAVEIAREEIVEKVINWIENNFSLYEGISGYYVAKELKQAMKDE